MGVMQMVNISTIHNVQLAMSMSLEHQMDGASLMLSIMGAVCHDNIHFLRMVTMPLALWMTIR